jgi:SPP1 family predicted phage head-tail adaptor
MPEEIELTAGLLDQRVDLLAPLYNDPDDDEITGWQLVDTVWASVKPNYALEQNESGRTIAVVAGPIVIRYRSDIDHRWRIQRGTHTYEIEGIVNVASRGAQLQLTCKEVL